MYIDKLANGINPLDDTEVNENDIVNNVRISRCLFFVADTLNKIIENGGITAPVRFKINYFDITAEELANFKYSDTPIPISEITKRINDVINPDKCKKFTHRMFTEWLVSLNMLTEIKLEDNKTTKRPTENGFSIGISLEERIGQYDTYYVVVYDKSAQEFIIDNIFSIIDHFNEKNRKDNQGTPWTSEQEQLLIEMFNNNVSIREMASALKRTNGGIRAKLQKMGYEI